MISTFCLLVGLCSLSGILAASPSDWQGSRPNIILIMADDLGYADICAYGCSKGQTPNIDALAREGARFTDAYVSAPICSPSRAGMMTGRYQHRFGHEFNAGGAMRSHRLGLGTPVEEVMLPERLRQAGYVTGMVGKWHLGSIDAMQPQARGFDEFFGFLHGGNQYFDVDHLEDVEVLSEVAPRSIENPILRGTTIVQESEYLTDAFTREAEDFIDRHAGAGNQPFFLYLAYNAPHTPLQVTKKYYDRFPEIKDRKSRIYAAMVSAVDDGIGRLTKALDRHDLAENTLLLFTSDNGCATYTQACTNAPLAQGKLLPFEGGVRVPFIMRWAGQFPNGQVISTQASTLDIVPTALALAGVDVPLLTALRFDGQSLLPAIDGDPSSPEALFWRNGKNWGVRAGQWKLVSLNNEKMLFDLSADIGESRNLIDQQPAEFKRLNRLFKRWSRQTVPPLWPTKGDIHIPLMLPGIGERTIDISI